MLYAKYCFSYANTISVLSFRICAKNIRAGLTNSDILKMPSDDKGANAPSSDSNSNNLLLNQPIVIDNGTATIKAGFAGGSKPKVCLHQHPIEIQAMMSFDKESSKCYTNTCAYHE